MSEQKNPTSFMSKNGKTPNSTELGKFFIYLKNSPMIKVRKALLLFTFGVGFLNGRKCSQDGVQLLQLSFVHIPNANICMHTHV